ncbi:hypothetical protein ABZ368_19290 [Streptomyces sp. NPDC005908]|uniref:hypothetical protein n=1 Tax=Streptomyces sp. NPDC005908 TaxID=3157084 RepID=UPI003402B1C5
MSTTTERPAFFQPGRAYQRRRWIFQCLAVAPAPHTGETRAVGFVYRDGETGAPTALDPDDWAHGQWTDTTPEQPAAAVPDRPALALLTEIYEELGHDHRAPHLAAALLDQHARALAEQVTALGKARGWSTWAADYIHPERAFVDPGEDDEPPVPAEGDRYVKRAEPDAGRIVTVNRVWTADDGHTAVAYEWHDPRASYAGSACPLDVFHRTYEAQP